jgi:hypothetical protein
MKSAQIINNEKRFKVIKMDVIHMLAVFPGTLCICDHCNEHTVIGYYICVLNMIYCPDCFNIFIQRATNYVEDHEYERGRFNIIMENLNRNNISVQVVDHE